MADGESRGELGPITRLILRTARIDPAADPSVKRSTFGWIEGWISIVVNTVLFVIKLALGMISGSIALIADAAHTFADSLTSIVVIISARVSRKPPDKEHPFGHGRVESIATVTCAALLGVTAFEFGKSSIERIFSATPVDVEWWVIVVVIATIPVKEWLARFARALGKESGNTTLEAEFWHHRSDVYATAVVVIGMVGARYHVSWFDGAMGLVISMLLAKVAYEISRGAVDSLLGSAPSDEEIHELYERARAVEGVRGVHDIVVHRYGDTRFVSLHVETSDQKSAAELHHLAEEVERSVGDGHHGSVCVHVDPVNRDHPAYALVERVLREAVAGDQCLRAFHDLRVTDGERGFRVLCDICLETSCSHDEEAITTRIAETLKRETSADEVIVEIEPRYSYQK